MSKPPLIIHDDSLAGSTLSAGARRPDFDLPCLVTVPPQPLQDRPRRFRDRFGSFAKEAGKRSLIGLFWHLFFAFLFNWAAILWGVGMLAAAIAAAIGWKVAAPDKDKAKSVIEKVKAAAPAAVPLVGVPAAVEAARARQKELELKIEEQKQGLADRLEAERERRGQERKDKLLARAAMVGLTVDESWSPARLEMEVERAEDNHRKAEEAAREKAEHDEAQAKYDEEMRQYREQLKSGPNARCPFCRREMRVSDAAMKHTLRCSKCLRDFTGRQARAFWTPPAPPKPPRAGLIERVFR